MKEIQLKFYYNGAESSFPAVYPIGTHDGRKFAKILNHGSMYLFPLDESKIIDSGHACLEYMDGPIDFHASCFQVPWDPYSGVPRSFSN